METWTKRQLEIAGYVFEDATIEDVSLCKSEDKLYLILTLEENMHDPIVGKDYPINHNASVSVGRFSPFRVGLKTPISVNLKSPMHHVCY